MRQVETVLLLVVVATAVATLSRRLRVPAPSLLVLAGIGVASVPGIPPVDLDPTLVGVLFLPPLLYAAGQDLPWRELRSVWRPVAVLALGLVAATAAAVAAVATMVSGLGPEVGLVLGAIVASTDPVAVTALGRRLSLPGRLNALIQGESLFNDATSLVLVRVTTATVVTASAASWSHGVSQFLLLSGGGAAIGAVVATLVALVRRRTIDPVLETVIALVTPYLAYVVAESARVSGVTAVVVASVMLAARPARIGAAAGRLQLHAVYETVVFLLESVIFAIIGLQLPTLVRTASGGGWDWIVEAAALAGTLLAVRALWVFPLWLVLRRQIHRRQSWRVPAIVAWSGARGVLPLTAALALPLSTAAGAPFPGREKVQLLTTAIIVLTLVVQGTTLGPLVRRSGVAVSPTDARGETRTATRAMIMAAMSYLDEAEETGAAPGHEIEHLRTGLRRRLERAESDGDGRDDDQWQPLRQDVIEVESAELARLYEAGDIAATTRRELQRRLDREYTSLAP